MDLLNTIKSLNLISLELLYFGYLKGWINKRAIIEFAMSDLNDSNAEGKLATIALDDSSDEREFNKLVVDYLKEIGVELNDKTKEKYKQQWLLIKLENLDASKKDSQAKLDELQLIYADFDHPEEMKSCSIYSNDEIDPMIAMAKIIHNLKLKYSPV